MKIGVILTSLFQGFLALAALIAVGEPAVELLPAVLSLIGAVASCIVAINGFQRYPAFIAAGVSAAAIACYCMLPVMLGGEYEEGFAIVMGTGLIILVAGPPAINAVLLFIASTPITRQPLLNPPRESPDGTSISS